MTETQFVILAIILLLVLDLTAIAARAAVTQVSHARLLSLNKSQAAAVMALLARMPRVRFSLNLTLVLARFSLAGLVLISLSRPFGDPPAEMLPAAVWGILLLSGVILFWIEWTLERSVTQNPETWAVRLSSFMKSITFILSPLLLLAVGMSRQQQNEPEISTTVTEDELKSLVDAGQEEGVFAQGERRMIYSIFQLGDTLAREIMIPRIDVLALDVNTPLPEAVDALLSSGHSRVPVYEESVDNTLGLLYAKDLLRVWREGSQLESLRNLLRPAYFVPEAKKVDELLSEMQNQRIHMAVVVDEYGGVAGLVTLEDIVEEVVGEIQDEYDQAEEDPYQVLNDEEIMFLGRVDLDDFNEIMGSMLPKEEADTIGGYIYSRMGRVPNVGDTVQDDNLLLTVEQVSGRRIRKVRARWLPEDEDTEEVKDEAAG